MTYLSTLGTYIGMKRVTHISQNNNVFSVQKGIFLPNTEISYIRGVRVHLLISDFPIFEKDVFFLMFSFFFYSYFWHFYRIIFTLVFPWFLPVESHTTCYEYPYFPTKLPQFLSTGLLMLKAIRRQKKKNLFCGRTDLPSWVGQSGLFFF